MKQTVLKITSCVAIALATSTVAMQHVSAAPEDTAATAVCHRLPSSWSGNISLEPGASYSTGVAVEPQPGIQAVVDSVAVSTGEGSPTALTVRIGGVAATSGAIVLGGDVAVTNGGTSAVSLTSVDLIVSHCHLVATTEALSVGSFGLSGRLGEVLPATGANNGELALIAFGLVSVGAGLVAVGRRRRLA